MSSHDNPFRGSGAWVWAALASVAVVMVMYGCSRQNSPASPSGVASAADEHIHSSESSGVVPDAAMLADVRAATAKYHDVSTAIANGYQLGYKGVVTGCIANPTLGAMGYHYFNWARMDDPSIAQDEPEVLVYHTADDGTLQLGAVEWVVPKTLWEQAGNSNPPVVFGHSLHVLNPVLNWYVAHAWVWTHNPSGMFADWNPDVSCP